MTVVVILRRSLFIHGSDQRIGYLIVGRSWAILRMSLDEAKTGFAEKGKEKDSLFLLSVSDITELYFAFLKICCVEETCM